MKSNNEKQKITLLHDEPLINDKDLSPRIKASDFSRVISEPVR